MPLKYLLSEDQIPRHWYNIIPDLPSPPAPVLHPGTLQPVKPDEFEDFEYPREAVEASMAKLPKVG